MRVHDFNIHKIGVFCIRHPFWGLIFFCLLAAIAVFGSTRVEIDRDLAVSWIGKSDRLARFRELDQKLEGGNSDIFLLVGGDHLWSRDGLENLQALHLDLALAEGVSTAFSVFSLQQGDVTADTDNSIIPQELEDMGDIGALRESVARHPLGRGYLMSSAADGEQWFLYVISLADTNLSNEDEAAIVRDIESIAAQHTTASGGTFVVGGLPKAKLDVATAVQNEFIFYSTAGLIIGIVIAAAYFRSLRFVIIASMCPAFAAFLSIGIMGVMGVKVSPLLDAVPSLVMAVAFTDTMHLMSSLRRQMADEGSVRDALGRTFETVGPACSVASITTAVAMLSLIVADAEIIRQFGKVAAAGTMMAVISLMISVPLLTRLLLSRRMPNYRGVIARPKDGILTRISGRIAGPIIGRRTIVAIIGGLATICVMIAYFQVGAKFRLGDQLPLNSSSRLANAIMDRHFDGANPVIVALDGSGSAMTPEDLLIATRQTRKALADTFPAKTVISIDALRGDTAADGSPSDDQFDRWVLGNEDIADSRLFSATNRISTLALQIRSAEAASVVSMANRMQAAIEPVLAASPGADFEITGLPVILATEIPAMIAEMNWGLFGAFFCVFILLGYLFRSARIIALAIAPNLLPVFAAGLVVSFAEGGLSLACIVGMTVGFGLAVDNSSHFLNRLLVESGGRPDVRLVAGTLVHIGPILMATTAILVFCLAVTSIGQGPNARIFSMTCIVVLVFALVSNLVVLPAVTAVFSQRRPD